MIGRSFGRYRIVESLGEGGMGTVWKAWDDLLGRSVALKLLNSRLADSDGARARLLREARAAGALEHPGIGAVYDAGEQDGETFIAMRLVDGGTVADRIAAQGALGLLDAVRIAASAAGALGHAHARGVLHRDVSPRNLMLTLEGQVVVVDFGLALSEGASRLTQSGMAVGTAHYMAPELALGETADRRSDIYSLGAVLYEMLTGEPPFRGDRLQAVLYAAVHASAVAPSVRRPGIPSELDRIVLRALSKKPQDRHQTMEALRGDLEALEADGVIPEDLAPPVMWPTHATLAPTTSLDTLKGLRARSATRTRRIAFAAAAVVSLSIAAGGVRWLALRPANLTTPKYASLAVLPFKNTSQDAAASDYLADGLSQSLITKLTQMTSLRVPPWMTVGRLGGTALPLNQLAASLGVEAILIGEYQTDGRRIGGKVSLIDGKNGHQVWADTFDEPLADLFSVQNRIAMETAAKILGRLSGKQAALLVVPMAASVEAYEYYLKGSQAQKTQTPAGGAKAGELLRRAIEIDPGFAAAWAALGTVHYDQHFFGWGGGLKEISAAEECFKKAIVLDPASTAARRGLIRVHWARGDSEACLKEGKLIATSGAKGAEAGLGRAEAYFFGGLEYRALPILRRVMNDDPANPAASWFLTLAACWSGNYEEAVKVGRRFLDAFGEDSEIHTWMAVAFLSLGRREEAEFHFRRVIETEPPGAVRTGRLFAAAFLRQVGRIDEADRLVLETIDEIEDKLQHNPDNFGQRGLLGIAYGMVGDVARMREEEDRIRRELGDAAVADMADGEGFIGEKQRFVELQRAALRAGFVSRSRYFTRAIYADPDLENYPGYKEFAAEEAVELKRLDALY